MTLSDRSRYNPADAEFDFGGQRRRDSYAPDPARQAPHQEDTMRGRPRDAEITRRRKQFVRLIVDGHDFDKAARDSQLSPVRALAILSEPEVRQLIALDVQQAA